MEVRSPFAGTVQDLYAATSDEVDVGKPLFAIIEGAGRGDSATAKPADSTPEKSSHKTPEKATPAPAKPTAPSSSASSASTAAPAASKGNRSETRVKMTRMRQRIAQRYVCDLFTTTRHSTLGGG